MTVREGATDEAQRSLFRFDRRAVDGDLEDLPDRQREDYLAVEIEGVPAPVQASRRDVEPATVRKNASRARQKLGRHRWGWSR